MGARFPALPLAPRAGAASAKPRAGPDSSPAPPACPVNRTWRLPQLLPVPVRHRGALGIRRLHEALRLLGQVAAARSARNQGFPLLPRSFQRDLGDPRPTLRHLRPYSNGRPRRVCSPWREARTPATTRARDTALFAPRHLCTSAGLSGTPNP